MAGRTAAVRFYDHGTVPDDGTEGVLGRWFEAGSEVPAEVVKRLGAPSALFEDEDGEESVGEPKDLASPSVPAGDPPTEKDLGTIEIPPKGGPGSGKDAWLEYAHSQGVKPGPGANRDDIIRDLTDAGLPTE